MDTLSAWEGRDRLEPWVLYRPAVPDILGKGLSLSAYVCNTWPVHSCNGKIEGKSVCLTNHHHLKTCGGMEV
jgi:hypothetical protein